MIVSRRKFNQMVLGALGIVLVPRYALAQTRRARLAVMGRFEVVNGRVVSSVLDALGENTQGVISTRSVKRWMRSDGTLAESRGLTIIEHEPGFVLPPLGADAEVIDEARANAGNPAELRKLERWGFSASGPMSLDDIAKGLCPQYRGVDAVSVSSPSGTFTDNFNEGSNTYLEDHTPSGGTAWTLVTGSGQHFRMFSGSGCLRPRAGTDDGFYTCDDQGSANHYTQALIKNITSSSLEDAYVCVRTVDINNWVGWVCNGTGATEFNLASRISSTIDATHYQKQGVDESVYKIEAVGTNYELFEDGVSMGSAASIGGVSSSETSQGLVNLQGDSGSDDWIDNFEAGVVSAGGGAVVVPNWVRSIQVHQ